MIPSRPVEEGVRLVTKLQHDRTYRIAVENHVAQGGDRLASLEEIEGRRMPECPRATCWGDRARSGVAVMAELDRRIEGPTGKFFEDREEFPW